jgi:AcrR family transcriptional regulator
MSARTRHAQQRAELKDIILQAAREVFVREGYDQVSMRKLAQKIEYSPGTIYLHFTSKEALLNALIEESFARLALTLEKSGGHADPVETLRRGLRAYVDFGLRHPQHYHFAFGVKPVASQGYRPHRAFEYLRQCVRCCIDGHRFRAIDAETAAQLLWAAVHGITSLLIARPDFPWVRRGKLIDEVIDNALRGLSAEA